MPKGVEYVPMLWGNTDGFTGGWKAAADKAIASGSTHLLGFNEPDHPAPQSNIDWQTAQKSWNTYMTQYSGKAKLGSPAVTNGVTGSDGHIWGLDWLNKFLSDDGVAKTVDFVAVHWYGGPQASVAESLADLQKHMNDAKTTAKGKPVWLTEFQYLGPGDASDFVSQAVQWMDKPEQSYIERYSYFMVSQGSLVQGNTLSKLGSAFATA
jgi:O-glycosyl hydrolase